MESGRRRSPLHCNRLRIVVAAVAAAALLTGCTTGGFAPGVNAYDTGFSVIRLSDNTEAVFGNDLTQVEPTASVLTDDFDFYELGEVIDTVGVNFILQLPTRYRSRQATPESPSRVTGTFSYAVANLYYKYSRPVLSFDRTSFGFGLGRATIEGEARFPGDTQPTRIEAESDSALVFYISMESRRLAGLDNLIARFALSTVDFRDDRFEFLIVGVVITFGYLFGADLFSLTTDDSDGVPVP